MRKSRLNAFFIVILSCAVLSACSVDRNDYLIEKGAKTVWLMSRDISYDEDGTVLSCTDYYYDLTGDLVSQLEYSGGVPYNRIDYSYEESRRGIKRIGEYSQSSDTAKSEELLDDNGNAIESKYFNRDGSCYSWSKCEYDDESRLLRWENLDNDGKLKNGMRWTYDKCGNMEKTIHYMDNPENPCDSVEYVYTYGNDGKIVSAVLYIDGVITQDLEYSYTYDRNGRLERCEIWSGEEYAIEEYDSEGNLLYCKDSETEYFYEYDDAGNRISLKIQGEHDFFWWHEYSYTSVKK